MYKRERDVWAIWMMGVFDAWKKYALGNVSAYKCTQPSTQGETKTFSDAS